MPVKETWLLIRHPVFRATNLRTAPSLALPVAALLLVCSIGGFGFGSMLVRYPPVSIADPLLWLFAFAVFVYALFVGWLTVGACWHAVARLMGANGSYRRLLVMPGHGLALCLAETFVFSLFLGAFPTKPYLDILGGPVFLVDLNSYVVWPWVLFVSFLSIWKTYNLDAARSVAIMAGGLVIGIFMFLIGMLVMILMLQWIVNELRIPTFQYVY